MWETNRNTAGKKTVAISACGVDNAANYQITFITIFIRVVKKRVRSFQKKRTNSHGLTVFECIGSSDDSKVSLNSSFYCFYLCTRRLLIEFEPLSNAFRFRCLQIDVSVIPACPNAKCFSYGRIFDSLESEHNTINVSGRVVFSRSLCFDARGMRQRIFAGDRYN